MSACLVCPPNTWKSTEDTAPSCNLCPSGTSTNGATQSTSPADCIRELISIEYTCLIEDMCHP